MGLRPAACYSKDGKRAYSRYAKTVQRKNFIGAVPGLKVRQFNVGNSTKKFEFILDLKAGESVQIRDNALEAARVSANRYLAKKLGKDGYFMKIRIYPHNVLRENKQAQGAGADRVSQGMSHPFGKPIGRAARIRAGAIILSVLVDEKHVEIAKKALLRAKAKLPCRVAVIIHKDVKSIGTKPSKRKLIEKEKELEEEEKKEEEVREEGKKEEEKVEEGPKKEEEKEAEAKAEGKEKEEEKKAGPEGKKESGQKEKK